MKYHGHRYTHHKDPAIRLLNRTLHELPIRSIEADIVTCAMLYLEGDLKLGGTVKKWWKDQDQKERKAVR